MKVWITKYALTSGIEEAEATLWGRNDNNVQFVKDGYTQYYHGEGKDWHRTHAAAVSKAIDMKAKRIASLKKSIIKLEALKFQ